MMVVGLELCMMALLELYMKAWEPACKKVSVLSVCMLASVQGGCMFAWVVLDTVALAGAMAHSLALVLEVCTLALQAL